MSANRTPTGPLAAEKPKLTIEERRSWLLGTKAILTIVADSDRPIRITEVYPQFTVTEAAVLATGIIAFLRGTGLCNHGEEVAFNTVTEALTDIVQGQRSPF